MTDLVFLSRPPCRALGGHVARISGFSSRMEPSWFLETAELVFPLVFNLGRPWDIQLGREGDANRYSSFTAGLYPGPVAVSCDAGAELLQVDLTPSGAACLFGGAAADLAGRVVELKDVDRFGSLYEAIHDQLHCATDWTTRFELVERFLIPRFSHPASTRIQASWRLLAQGRTVAETAAAIGLSTRHLSTRFRQETGIRPITAARMLRFQRARVLALRSYATNWADIAVAAGYSDQAHLIRAFHEFAGEPPTVWAQSARPSEPRLHI